MHKKDLLQRLKIFIQNPDETPPAVGMHAIVGYIMHYLSTISIPSDEKYNWWHIEDHLPEILVAAIEQLRRGESPKDREFRDEYMRSTQEEVPNLTEVGQSDFYARVNIVHGIDSLMKKIIGKDYNSAFEVYCYRQDELLVQRFDKFVREIYQPTMWSMVDESKTKGMSGKFGETELRTFMMAGRIMFTFSRRIDKDKPGTYNKNGDQILNEEQITFIGEDGDPFLFRAGIQSVYCDFRTAYDMIDEVLKNWNPQDKEQFHSDRNVMIA